MAMHTAEYLADLMEGLPEHVAAGISGGADSMALLQGLLCWRSRKPRKVTVLHFNHGTRPGENE